MKNIVVSLLIVVSLNYLQAQKIIEKSIDYKNQFIELDAKFASDITVKTWDKKTVYFKADIYIKDSKYLDLYELDLNESSSSIVFESNAEAIFKKQWEDYKKKYPNKKHWYNSSEDRWYEFNYTLYVPKNAKFKVTSINGNLSSELIEGDFTADLINGDINILKYAGDFDLKTINGEIDLRVIDADLVAETIHGDIFADEKLNLTSKDRHVGQKVYAKTKTIKNTLRLNTINGNMYLRL